MQDKYNSVNRAICERDVDSLLARYNVTWRCLDASTFVEATTHKSYKGKNEGDCPRGCVPLQETDYERLEHLGDSVVELIVTDYLHQRYPTEREAFLTKLRMKIVSGVSLAKLSLSSGIPRWVLLSAQAEADRSRTKPCIAEDVIESFCGALFTAAGYPVARAWFVGVMEEHLDIASVISQLRCSKDRLIQHCLRLYGYRPKITISKVRDSLFNAEVTDESGVVIGCSVASSSREAEIEACQGAWEYLSQCGEQEQHQPQ
jgi:ribonuclease-3